MPDRFDGSDTQNTPECWCLHSYTEFGSRAYRIHTEPCKKTPIRYETESDTLVIRYRVNGATVIFGCRDKAKVRNDVIFKQWG